MVVEASERNAYWGQWKSFATECLLPFTGVTLTKPSVKVVTMLSIKHIDNLTDTGRKHLQTKQNIMKPNVIVDYKKSMSSVDSLNRKIVPYCIQWNGLKWYRETAALFMEITMLIPLLLGRIWIIAMSLSLFIDKIS